MCPACAASAAMMITSVMSTGGLTAFVVEKFRSKKEAKGKVMRLVDSLLVEIDQEAQTTKRVLERIPENKLTWKPHPKAFSLGQLALHIASVPGSVAAAAAPEAEEPAGGSGHILQKPCECQGNSQENGRRPAPVHLELDEK